MYRCVYAALVAQLSLGCSTVRSVAPLELREQMRSSRDPIALRTQDGSTMRLDPNTEVRLHLHGGSVTRWVRGKEIWHSPIGLSFGEHGGVFLLRWEEIAGAEVRNLSSGKTAAAILVSALVVGAVVVAVVAAVKGGGGGSLNIGSTGGSISGSRKRQEQARAPVAQRQLQSPAVGGVHVHVPVVLMMATHQAHHASPSWSPQPQPVQAGNGGQERYSLVSDSTANEVPSEMPTLTSPMALAAAGPTFAAPRASAAEIRAEPLFDGSTRRRFSIQLVAAASAGTELVRFDRYEGSLYVGMRLRDAFELGAGVRHFMSPVPQSAGGELLSSVVGFGRIGAHLGFGVKKPVAIALSLDAGSGLNAMLHFKGNIGLRVKPTEMLTIGVFPFSPTFNYYYEDSPFQGALRWTFPSTIEVAFNY